MPDPSSKINHQQLKAKLIAHRDRAKRQLHSTHQKASAWIKQNNFDLSTIRQKSTKLLAGASLSGTLLLSPPASTALTPGEAKLALHDKGFIGVDQLKQRLSHQLTGLIDIPAGHLDSETETKVKQIIFSELGIKATPILEGQQLNHSVGYIGYEQHLKRYPGDTIEAHDEELQAGIAPGLGGWGYFTYSKDTLTETDIMKEKYYFAVPVMYLPNWRQDLSHLVKWYKHRKMIAINPATGEAVVGVIADAGPAKFTGKQFGGSPELMRDLSLTTGKKKGKIILYFIDDPEDKIPLGPVKSNYQLAAEIKQV